MRAVIRGTGMYVPPNRVHNDTLSKIMDTTDEWIQQRTGIVTRHYASPDQATSDLAAEAAKGALAEAGVEPDEVDYVVFATMTPDYYFPGAGPLFQRKIGMKRHVPSLDIRQQCAGFVYGLQLTDALIRSGQYRTVLVVGAEAHVGFMPWKAWDIVLDGADRAIDTEEYAQNTLTRDRTVLFGDGAGVCVVCAEDGGERGVMDVLVHSDGDYFDRLWANFGGSVSRPFYDPEQYARGEMVPVVQGREVFRLAVTLMPEVTVQILKNNDLSLDDVDLVIMHQANLRINEAVQKRLGLPDEKVFNNIQKYGNTTAATIPMAFHEARQHGRVKDGDLVCFVGLGSGLNWGAVLYRA